MNKGILRRLWGALVRWINSKKRQTYSNKLMMYYSDEEHPCMNSHIVDMDDYFDWGGLKCKHKSGLMTI